MPATRRPYAPRVPLEERREQALDVALELVTEEGWAALSMEAIARRLEVTRPVVYRAWPSLAQLLAALLEREQRRVEGMLDAIVPEFDGALDADPRDLLADGLRAFFASVQAHPATWKLILLPEAGTPATVHRLVTARREALAARLEVLVAWGFDRLGGPAGLDREVVSRALLVMAEEAGRLVLTDPQRWPAERFERFVTTAVEPLLRYGSV